MNLLKDLNKLHDKWDGEGGKSGSDKYEDALYHCINDLADLILKHEKAQQKDSAYHHNKCNTCGKPMSGDCPNCERLWAS